MDNLSVIFGAMAGAIATAVPVVMRALVAYKKHRSYERRRLYIGVYGCDIPLELRRFADFTDIKAARESGYKVCVLHLRNPSYGLRYCDFVVGNLGQDPKVLSPTDHEALMAVIAGRESACIPFDSESNQTLS